MGWYATLVALPLRRLVCPGARPRRRAAPRLQVRPRPRPRPRRPVRSRTPATSSGSSGRSGIFSEARLQDLVVGDTALIRFLNGYYLLAHVAVTAAAFVWLYARHPDLPPVPQRDGRHHGQRTRPASAAASRSAAHVPEPRLRRHRQAVRPGGVRRGQPLQGVRQPIRGDAVVALRLGAGDRVGGAARRPRAGGATWCSRTR